MSKNNNTTDDANVISFHRVKQKQKENEQQRKTEQEAGNMSNDNGDEGDIQELIEIGVEAFNQQTIDSNGFVSIVFDKDDNPQVTYAGNINFVQLIGMLEILKQDMLNGQNTVSVQLDDDEE